MLKKKALASSILIFFLISPVFAVSYVDLERTKLGELSGEWAYYRTLTINSSDIDKVLTDFPVLLYLSNSTGESGVDVTSIFDELGSNYKKISVQTNGGEECYVEVEHWSATNEEAWLWVKVPSISNTSDTTLTFYYHSSHADNDAYVGDPNSTPAENVWDNNFKLVTHMRDDPDTSHVRDSTGNDNDGTKKGANEPQVVTTGKIDDAQEFDGDDDYIDTADIDLLTGTLMAWIERDATGVRHEIFHKGPDDTMAKDSSYVFSVYSDNKLQFFLGDGTNYQRVFSTGTINTAWHYVAITWDGSTIRFYIDGSPSGTPAQTITPQNVTDKLWIGKTHITGYPFTFDGVIEEPHISDTPRSSAWVKACYETQRDHLLSYGSEEGEAQYPANITVTDLEANYEAKLYNSTEGLVCNATANSEGTATLTLPSDYRSSAFEGTFRIYDDNSTFLFSKWFEDMRGGDEYRVRTKIGGLTFGVIALVVGLSAFLIAIASTKR